VGEVEGEPEEDELPLEEKELLTEEHCVGVCVAQSVVLLL
jgi:hypothetical protein